MGKSIVLDGKYAINNKREGCDKQTGLGKMSETNKRSGWKKGDHSGSENSKRVSTRALLFNS